jgi:hypothetical protein
MNNKNCAQMMKSFSASDLTCDLFGEILGKMGRKGGRSFGGIFRVSGADATLRDSRVGDDCGAANLRRLPGCGPEGSRCRAAAGVARVEKGRRYNDRVFRN